MAVYKKLQEIAPAEAERIHPNNVRRVIRALEAAMSGEKLISTVQRKCHMML